jgi:urease accessory protein
VLRRQRVPYPFHATRTFYLDQSRPDLATLYMHRTHGLAVEQATHLDVGECAFAAFTPDPLVVFPGAEISCTTERIIPDACPFVFCRRSVPP